MKFEGTDVYTPADEIPASSCIPANTYEIKIVDIDVTYSREKQLRMVQVHFEIASGPFEGTALQVGPYVLGTENDPDAQDPELWRKPQAHKAYGIIRWGKLLEAIDLKVGGMLFETCIRAVNRHFFAIVTVSKDENPASPFYLSERNQIPDNGYFKLSQRPMAGTPGAMGSRDGHRASSVSQEGAQHSGGPPVPREREGAGGVPSVPRRVLEPVKVPEASAENGTEESSVQLQGQEVIEESGAQL